MKKVIIIMIESKVKPTSKSEKSGGLNAVVVVGYDTLVDALVTSL